MRVLIVSAVDTGGQGYRIAQAFKRHAPDWVVDSISDAGPLQYPQERYMHPAEKQHEIKRLADAADVIHLRNSLTGWEKIDAGRNKPLILHHHGTQFRMNHGAIAASARAIGATQIASTIDLAMFEPDIEWLPSPYNLDALASLRDQLHQPSERIRIAHFPTSEKVKSSHVFAQAMNNLMALYNVDVITNYRRGKVWFEAWSDVMLRKAQADIYYDQCKLGYGNNAVEAWGMGMPVLAGVEDQAVRAEMLRRWGRLPFVETSEQTMQDDLAYLVLNPNKRSEYALLGLAHVKRWHDERVVVEQLKRIYSEAKPTYGREVPRVVPGWLAARRRAKALA